MFCSVGVDEGFTRVLVAPGDVEEGIGVFEGMGVTIWVSDGGIVGVFVFVGMVVIPGALPVSIISCVIPAPI